MSVYLSDVIDNELVVEKISFKIRILDANADGNLEINKSRNLLYLHLQMFHIKALNGYKIEYIIKRRCVSEDSMNIQTFKFFPKISEKLRLKVA